jgi:hypothetical protein
MFTDTGPFGKAMRCNRGYVFLEVPRESFDGTPLDISGWQPFTLVAWVNFYGQRHLVAGIWDEGDWEKYAGRRQFALFGGLFGSKGVIAHISATGAASFPQSEISGSQFARMRAIDGAAFENGQWVCMAMTFDPEKKEVTAYLNGRATPNKVLDPVVADVYQEAAPRVANPFPFNWPIFSPRRFVLKFNGYRFRDSGVYEHWVEVDLVSRQITYGRIPEQPAKPGTYRVRIDLRRGGESLRSAPGEMEGVSGACWQLPEGIELREGDGIETSLWQLAADGSEATRVGTPVGRTIQPGAPFTIGRALGLGGPRLDRGTEMWVDGVAVFNRVLKPEELRAIAFVGP